MSVKLFCSLEYLLPKSRTSLSNRSQFVATYLCCVKDQNFNFFFLKVSMRNIPKNLKIQIKWQTLMTELDHPILKKHSKQLWFQLDNLTHFQLLQNKVLLSDPSYKNLGKDSNMKKMKSDLMQKQIYWIWFCDLPFNILNSSFVCDILCLFMLNIYTLLLIQLVYTYTDSTGVDFVLSMQIVLIKYNIYCDSKVYNSLTQSLLAAAPASRPATTEKTTQEAATDWSLGSWTILGAAIMVMLARYPLVTENRMFRLKNTASEEKQTEVRCRSSGLE